MHYDSEEMMFLGSFLSNSSALDLIKQIIIPSPTPIIITNAGALDSGYKIVYANQAFLTLTGYELAEIVSLSPAIFQGPRSNKTVLAHLGQSLASCGTFHGASMNYRKDGTCYPVEWNIWPIKNSGGEIQFFISMQKDLSNLFRVATQVKEVNEHFRAVIADVASGKIHSENIKTQTQSVVETLRDNARIYTPSLTPNEKVVELDNAFFDFDADDDGVLATQEEKTPMSALAYSQEERLSAEEVASLVDTLADFMNELEYLQNDTSQISRLNSMEAKLRELSDAIFFLIDFTETAIALNEVASCLANANEEQLQGFLVDFLRALGDEIETWLNAVFVKKTAENIYAGEKMIIASAKQISAFLPH